MDLYQRRAPGRQRSGAALAVWFLALFSLPLLAGCGILGEGSLKVYKSEVVHITVPILAGWEVMFEQEGGAGTAFLTMMNDYSGILVTRAPRSMLFPVLDEDAGVTVFLDSLVDLGQGSFTAIGPTEEQPRSGYRLATVPIEMEEVSDMAGPSTGTLLLAMEDDQVVVALFYCTLEQLESCDMDLVRSVKGFKLIKP